MRSKQKKFQENEENPLVVQMGKPIFDTIKGKWKSDFFKNDHPLVLELACGRGEYTIGLGKVYPEKNFVGVDIKGSRIWKGAKYARENEMQNIAFLRTQMHMIDRFYDEQEVDEIWLVHPDPRPKESDERRRLTNLRYMNIYRTMLKKGGQFRLKTDNTGLYEYTLQTLDQMEGISDLQHTKDLYHSAMLEEHHGIRTRYELEFVEQGESIKYLKCRFD